MKLPIPPIRTQFVELTEEEYMHLCDLIICGSTMAAYLTTTKQVSQIMQTHARYWQRLVKEFKPLLTGVLNDYQKD